MPTLYIIGDSTVEDNKPPFRGWGWALKERIAPEITVKNLAISGRSTKSFIDEGRFVPIERDIAPGDALMIQFGHNDEKDDAERHTDPHTTYTQNLKFFCDTAKKAGATPVLLTPVCRRFFTGDNSLMYTHGEYPLAVRMLAEREGVALCDLKAMSRELYVRLGQEKAAELFVRLAPGENPDFPNGHDDPTHFNADGARVIAGLIADWMAADARMAAFLKAR